jgi:hypothetical protein
MEILGLSVNLLAVIVSAIAAYGIGALWYMFLFKDRWVGAHGFTPAKMQEYAKSAPIAMGVSFVGYLVTALILSLIFAFAKVTDLQTALYLTAGIWLGFPAVMSLMNAMYAGGSLVVYAIDLSYELVYSLAMAFIIIWMH